MVKLESEQVDRYCFSSVVASTTIAFSVVYSICSGYWVVEASLLSRFRLIWAFRVIVSNLLKLFARLTPFLPRISFSRCL